MRRLTQLQKQSRKCCHTRRPRCHNVRQRATVKLGDFSTVCTSKPLHSYDKFTKVSSGECWSWESDSLSKFYTQGKKRHLQCPLNWQVNPLKKGNSTSELLTGGLLQTQPANHPAIFVPQLTDKRPPTGGGKRIWWLISIEPDSATFTSVIDQENCQRLNWVVTESG